MHWGKKITYSVCFTVLITFWAIVVAAIEKIKTTGSAQAAYASLDPAFFNRSFDWMFAGFSMLFGGLVLSPDKRHASAALVMGLVLAFTLFFVNVAFSLFHPYILVGWSQWSPVVVSGLLGLLVLAICAGLS
jgi:hypothetical protein